MTSPAIFPDDHRSDARGDAAATLSTQFVAPGECPPHRRRIASAGGVVFRCAGDGLEAVLCARLRPGHQDLAAPNALSWRLPKGTPEPGETVEQTARREVQEETGILVKVLAPITSISYCFVGYDDGVHYDKTVHFYLMEPVGGSTSDHDAEFDLVEWREFGHALEILEYHNERSVLKKALSLINPSRAGWQHGRQ